MVDLIILSSRDDVTIFEAVLMNCIIFSLLGENSLIEKLIYCFSLHSYFSSEHCEMHTAGFSMEKKKRKEMKAHSKGSSKRGRKWNGMEWSFCALPALIYETA